MKISGLALTMFAAALLLSACAGSKARSAREQAARDAAAVEAARAADVEPDVRDLSAVAVAELQTVRFAYDSDHLDSSARSVLKANAGYLKAHPKLKLQIAGHCDQRGTVPYNLALGQRRARAVRDFYRLLGAGAERIATISYGSERPACPETTESCWSLNRRAETLVMTDKSLAGSPREAVKSRP